jgi:hypothetical protein
VDLHGIAMRQRGLDISVRRAPAFSGASRGWFLGSTAPTTRIAEPAFRANSCVNPYKSVMK